MAHAGFLPLVLIVKYKIISIMKIFLKVNIKSFNRKAQPTRKPETRSGLFPVFRLPGMRRMIGEACKEFPLKQDG
jgi:hypothetical protein